MPLIWRHNQVVWLLEMKWAKLCWAPIPNKEVASRNILTVTKTTKSLCFSGMESQQQKWKCPTTEVCTKTMQNWMSSRGELLRSMLGWEEFIQHEAFGLWCIWLDSDLSHKQPPLVPFIRHRSCEYRWVMSAFVNACLTISAYDCASCWPEHQLNMHPNLYRMAYLVFVHLSWLWCACLWNAVNSCQSMYTKPTTFCSGHDERLASYSWCWPGVDYIFVDHPCYHRPGGCHLSKLKFAAVRCRENLPRQHCQGLYYNAQEGVEPLCEQISVSLSLSL